MSFQTDSVSNDPNRFYVACSNDRYGSAAFQIAVEYYLYPPHIQELNDMFQLRSVEYMGLSFNVISVPFTHQDQVKDIAQAFGMKVSHLKTEIDGKPFPIKGKNVWTLVNDTRPGLMKSPLSPEREQTHHIIRHAAKIWNADVTEHIAFNDGREVKLLGLTKKG